MILMATSLGDIKIELYDQDAPETVKNFLSYVNDKFYDGIIFHRVIKGFMIQGGDPNTKDPAKENSYGEGTAGYRIKAEFNDHPHDRGVISMAREDSPDTASCQFFICLAPVHRLDHKYTTFGKLIKGESVLDKIGDTPVTVAHGERSKPIQRVTIESIQIVPADSVK